jgi:hypothetical protein
MGMMLALLTKRLCPLMTLALALGCGKKINDPETTSSSTQGQSPELPTALTLQINEALSPVKSYTLSKNAWFRLPTRLTSVEGNVSGKMVKIYYNLVNPTEYEFNCTYRSSTSANQLSFVKCESKDNIEIISNSTDLERMEFPMDKGLSIKMLLSNPSGTNLKIESVHLVDWK